MKGCGPASSAPSRAERPSETIQGRRLALSVLFVRVRPVWPWIVLALLVFVGWDELRRVDLAAVRTILRETEPGLLLALLAGTFVNLAVAGFYDVIALGRRGRPPGATARWAVGVLSFAWSNFLTFGPLAGPALRLWLLKPLGVGSTRALGAVTLIQAAFFLTLLGWCGAISLPLPEALDVPVVRIAVAVPFLALVAAGLSLFRRLERLPDAVRAWEGNSWALAAVGGVDWFLAWIVFHLALNGFHGSVSAAISLRAFFLGQLVGLLSLIPAGLGSADLFWGVVLISAVGGQDRLVAAFLLYRVVYYLLPWAFATVAIAGRLVRAGPRVAAFVRSAAASYAVVCGSVLLASAASPDLAARSSFINRTVPLLVVEISHGLSVLVGFLLLLLSRGLARGYRSSQRLAVALFLAGGIASFLKGLDYEEAGLALLVAGLLVAFQRSFTREGTLHPSLEFVLAVGACSIVLFGVVGLGSYETFPELASVFTRFGAHAQTARFGRGLLILSAVIVIVAIHLAQRTRTVWQPPSERDIERAVEEARRFGRTTSPLLVAAGDKAIFRTVQAPAGETGPSRRQAPGFIAYRASGPFLVAYSDPVCPPGAERDLLGAFLDFAEEQDREVVLYQISPAFIPVAHDFGFSFFKLGEEAFVELSAFTLRGDRPKHFRNVVNRVEKSGGRFEIVERERLREIVPQLREVSEAWLKAKGASEKQFSVGRFHEAYLLRFPCAVVWDASGRVLAFANVLEGASGEEISVDLVRYREEDITDYLFVRLAEWGRQRGVRRLNLGMAPLATVGEERWARPFERLASLLFRHGEQWYNYQGLRRYKEKFHPVWEPRYMAYPKPWSWPLAVVHVAVLIAGGWRAAILPRRSAA